jgi:hypothetical protein
VVVKERLDLAAEGANLILIHSDGLGYVASGGWQRIRVRRGLNGCLQQHIKRSKTFVALLLAQVQSAALAHVPGCTCGAASACAVWFCPETAAAVTAAAAPAQTALELQDDCCCWLLQFVRRRRAVRCGMGGDGTAAADVICGVT